MSWTYDPTQPRGQCRLLCTDTDTNNQIFSDAEIDAFLLMEGTLVQDPSATTMQTVMLAAAQALDTIADSETLIQKKVQLTDFKTDGPAEAAQLHARAKTLREHAMRDTGDFDWAELVYNPASERERLYDQALRGAL